MFNYDNQQDRVMDRKSESWLREAVKISLRSTESSPRNMWGALTNKNARFSMEELCISREYERNKDDSRQAMQPPVWNK